MFDVGTVGCDLQMFHISYCWLIASCLIEILITYYISMQSYKFGHCQLQTNNIVCKRLLWLKFFLYHFVDNIIIPIACVSGADVLNSFGICFLWPRESLVYIFVGFYKQDNSLSFIYTCQVKLCLNFSQVSN